MFALLRKFIREEITKIAESDDEEILNDSDPNDEDDEDVQSEFCSVGGAGGIGQFGFAVPLGGKSNAASVEKKNKKNKKN